MTGTPSRRERPWQFSLSDSVVGMVGLAVLAAQVRGTRGFGDWKELNGNRVLGLGTFAVVVGLGFFLVRSIHRLVQDRVHSTPDPGRRAWVLAIGWRVLALSALAIIGVAESWLLSMEAGSSDWVRSGTDYYRFESYRKLFPICGLLGLAGLTLGMVPGRPRTSTPAGQSKFWWVSVVWASLAAILLFIVSEAILPYLILIAIEGNSIALFRAQAPTPGLWRRIAESTPMAIVSLLSCQATALYAARDLRFPTTIVPAWSILPRLISMTAAVSSATVLVVVTLPRLHRHFAAGFWRTLGAPGMIAIGFGFAIFCAGMAARAVVSEDPEPPTHVSRRSRWVRIRAWLGRGLLISVLFLSAVQFLNASGGFPRSNGAGIGGWLTDQAREFLIWSQIQVPYVDLAWPFFAPDFLIWELLLAWLAVQGMRLVIRGTAGRAAPFDRLAASPGALRRFLWPWAELTVVCLAALPTLLVSGIVAIHYLVNAVDWFHWPG